MTWTLGRKLGVAFAAVRALFVTALGVSLIFAGKANDRWDETLRLDLRYVDNWTFLTDIRLLWQTVSVVIRGTGAY